MEKSHFRWNNFRGAGHLLGRTHEVRNKQPAVQRDMGILENRSDCNGELRAASATLPKSLACGLLGFCPRLDADCIVNLSTLRTHGAFGPAQDSSNVRAVLSVRSENLASRRGCFSLYNPVEVGIAGHSACRSAPPTGATGSGALRLMVKVYSAIASHGGLYTAGLLSGNSGRGFYVGFAPTNHGPFAVVLAKSFLLSPRCLRLIFIFLTRDKDRCAFHVRPGVQFASFNHASECGGDRR
jgi:hypothetical protein